MNKPNIVSLQEYVYPELNVLEASELGNIYNFICFDEINEFKGYVGKNNSIDGFFLGSVLPKSDCSIQDVNSGFKRLEDFREKVPHDDEGIIKYSEDRLKRKQLFDYAYSNVNSSAGFEIYDFLENKGYVGKVPIIYLTSQVENDGMYLEDRIIKSDFNKKIIVLDLPVSIEELTDAFNKYFSLS